jgi:maltooligosyltrehalose trehalohydrolase
VTGSASAAPLLGARLIGGGAEFGAFVTRAVDVAVRLYDATGAALTTHPMRPVGDGYFRAAVPDVADGQRYRFVLDGREQTDPYARFLPDGVRGPAMVLAAGHAWRHDHGPRRPLAEQVIYELHVGTFTREGTYAAARARLPYLAELGVTALELMPLGAFPGARGWGYDGVASYAPFAPYGHPDELRRLVDEAHGLGLAVLLDVIYNHFGPAGCVLAAFSERYLTRDFVTPWGEAPDFRQPVMRRFVIDNARYWAREFRFDGLRLDATHAIVDLSPVHVLREVAEAFRSESPGALIFAEDDRNDPALPAVFGCDGLWVDDFHHHVRVTLTGEREGYYAAYEPGAAELARVITRGFSYEGQVYPPRGEPRGKPADALGAPQLVYCIQNHDQIGNRALGTRLCHDVDRDRYALATALLLFLPMTPLLFMGQEWAASSPFLFFSDHDAELGPKVTEGRRREFAAFSAFADPAQRALIPDPQAVATFLRTKLDFAEAALPAHREVLELYRTLLALRRDDRVFQRTRSRAALAACARGEVLVVERRVTEEDESRVLVANLGDEPVALAGLPGVTVEHSCLVATRPLVGDSVPALGAVVLACASRGAAPLDSARPR